MKSCHQNRKLLLRNGVGTGYLIKGSYMRLRQIYSLEKFNGPYLLPLLEAGRVALEGGARSSSAG